MSRGSELTSLLAEGRELLAIFTAVRTASDRQHFSKK
jgi:hypothetical protein